MLQYVLHCCTGYTGCFKKSFTTPLQLIPQLDEDDQEGHIHFQQDGAPPHYLGEVYAAVAKVTPEMLHSVWQDTDYRWEVCRITNGSHIEP